MTVLLAETILLDFDVKIALRHRFGGDKGTILRLDNDAIINIFDDGRYYLQGQNFEELLIAFTRIEEPWDPEKWTPSAQDLILPWFPPKNPPSRLDL